MAILTNGFNTTILFPGAGVVFLEHEVTPPGLDGGPMIEVTSMRNQRWRTFVPKALITLTKLDLKAEYDPMFYSTVLAQVNVNQLAACQFPTLTNTPSRKVTFWGAMNNFQPQSNKIEDLPLADVTITPTNRNNSGVETAPSVA